MAHLSKDGGLARPCSQFDHGSSLPSWGGQDGHSAVPLQAVGGNEAHVMQCDQGVKAQKGANAWCLRVTDREIWQVWSHCLNLRTGFLQHCYSLVMSSED